MLCALLALMFASLVMLKSRHHRTVLLVIFASALCVGMSRVAPSFAASPHSSWRPSELAPSVFIGTVTGIIVSVLIWAAQQFAVKVILPWHEDLIYKDAKIEGRWSAKATIEGADVERIWVITRKGHAITAKVTSTHGPDAGETYLVQGTFKNMVLTGSYENTDRASTDRGTYTLRLVHDGALMEGVLLASSSDSSCVLSSPYILTRVTRS